VANRGGSPDKTGLFWKDGKTVVLLAIAATRMEKSANNLDRATSSLSGPARLRINVEPAQEEQWVRRSQAGDREAFAALVERYWGRVHRWLSAMMHQAHAAEDLTQEVFLKAWLGLPALQAGSSFPSWIFRIARNCLIDALRGQAVHVLRLPEAVPAPGPEPLVRLQNQENAALLRQACARLPDLYRAAFLLWTVEDFSYGQIAEALEITEQTARWRVYKARQFLVQALRSQLDQTKP
jgi:RNA polymerase sigma-70 factor (ECF subfamily)